MQTHTHLSPRILVLITLFTVIAFSSFGQIRFPNIISPHMVLQQQSEVTIWGWAGWGEEIKVKPSWSEDTVKTVTDHQMKWRVKIKTPAAGGPYKILVRGNTDVVLDDVLIGEVWICSGQSNMEWSVAHGAKDATEDMPKSADPELRLFQVEKSASDSPQERGEGQWAECSPEAMKRFSAVGYYFGKKLRSTMKVPVGLINASWGGTPAEAWTPEPGVSADPALAASAGQLNPSKWWPVNPGGAWNSMIQPLVPYGIAGAIWYQGESNTAAPSTYAQLMKTMIGQWRTAFGKEFPFYFVQIAPFSEYGRTMEAALIREQQAMTLSVPKTGMAVVTDKVDNIKDIHPAFKKPVGDRLALMALAEVYPHRTPGYKSPVYKSMAVEKSAIRVSFDYAEVGLISLNGDPKEFEIAGADQKFYPATVKVEGSTVVVRAKEVKVPVAVRFAFRNDAVGNLFNKEGLPVSPFRTDTWEVPMVKK